MMSGSDHKSALDELYSSSQDPWQYGTNPDEISKYQAVIDALPARRYKSGLELGCSVGIFTKMIAPRVDRLLAVDISERALTQARETLSGARNIEFRQLDLISDDLAETFDLIVCSEVLYYVPPFRRLSTIRKISAWAEPDGVIALVHSTREFTREWTDIYGEGGGERLHDYFVRVMGHRPLLRIRQEGYELALLEGGAEPVRSVRRMAARLELGTRNVGPGLRRHLLLFVRRHPLVRRAAIWANQFRSRVFRR